MQEWGISSVGWACLLMSTTAADCGAKIFFASTHQAILHEYVSITITSALNSESTCTCFHKNYLGIKQWIWKLSLPKKNSVEELKKLHSVHHFFQVVWLCAIPFNLLITQTICFFFFLAAGDGNRSLLGFFSLLWIACILYWIPLLVWLLEELCCFRS